MIFVDTNVPMYVIGAPHPHQDDALRLLERATANHERLVNEPFIGNDVCATVRIRLMHRLPRAARQPTPLATR